MWFLHWGRMALERVPGKELTLVLDHVAAPNLFHRCQIVVEARTAPFEWRPHRRVLLGEPADAEA